MSELTNRERAVWEKRNSGLTFKQIAEELRLCPATVSFAYRKAYRKIEHEKERLKPAELEIYKKALEMATETANYWFRGSEAGKLRFLKDYSVNEFLEQARNLYGDK